MITKINTPITDAAVAKMGLRKQQLVNVSNVLVDQHVDKVQSAFANAINDFSLTQKELTSHSGDKENIQNSNVLLNLIPEVAADVTNGTNQDE